MLDTNKLIIEDKEGKIYLAWHVNHRGNFDDTWVDITSCGSLGV